MRIDLTTTKAEMQAGISKIIFDRIDSSVLSAVSIIKGILEKNIRLAIESSDVWKSLRGDSNTGLDAHFGIPKEENSSRLESIMKAWLEQINVYQKSQSRVGTRYRSVIRIEAIESDWATVTKLDAGVTTNKQKHRTDELRWLEWLLIGNISLPSDISSYKIDFRSVPQSRSGKAIMVKTNENPYQFPYTEIGGEPTPNDNFATRAFETLVSQEKIIMAEFEKAVRSAL